MAKLVLTPAQDEQLISMIKDRKDNKEVKDFFTANYQIDLPMWKLCYVREKVFGAKKPAESKRHYQRKSPGGGKEVPAENYVKEISKIMQQIDEGYKAVFKHLRCELVKSRAQVWNMMKGAGLEVPENEGKQG